MSEEIVRARSSLWRMVVSGVARAWESAASRPVRSAFAVALAVRLVAAAGIGLSTDGWLIPDEGSYLSYAEAIHRGVEPETLWPGYGRSYVEATATFMWQLVWLFDAFGPHRFVAQLPPVLYGAVTAGLTALIVSRRLGRSPSLGAGLVVGLLPSQVLWSSVVLRETVVWALVALMAYLVVWSAGRSRWWVLAAGLGGGWLCFVLLTRLRLQTAVVALFAFGLAYAVAGRPRLVRSGLAALFLLLAPMAVGIGPFGSDFAQGALSRMGYSRANLARWADSGFDYDDRPIDVHIGQKLGAAGRSLDEGDPVVAVIEAKEMVRHATHLTDQVTSLDVAAAVEGVSLASSEAADAAEQAIEWSEKAAESGDLAIRAAVEAGLDAEGVKAIRATVRYAGLSAEAVSNAARDARSAAAEVTETLETMRNVARLASEALEAAGRMIEEAEAETLAAGAWAVIDSRDEIAEPIETSARMIHKGIYNTMVRPLPWEGGKNLTVRAASIETPIWVALYVLAAVGLWRLRRDLAFAAFPAIFITGIVVGGAVSHGNLGTAFRHRGQVLFLLVVLAAVGVQGLMEARRTRVAADG